MFNTTGMRNDIMQTADCHRGPNLRRRLKAVAALWLCGLAMACLAPPIDAQPREDSTADSGSIRITADELVSRVRDNYAEFIGNVEAVQGDFVIRSERLRIHYRRAEGQSTPDPTGGNAIEKIVATGRVRITSGSRQAQTDRAEYLVDEGLVTLRGENSTVTDGRNSIRGSVIRLNRVDGRIQVEGGATERVRAVFHSSGQNPAEGGKDESQ